MSNLSPTEANWGNNTFTTSDVDERRRIRHILDGNIRKLLFGAQFERPWPNDPNIGVVEAPQVSSEVDG